MLVAMAGYAEQDHFVLGNQHEVYVKTQLTTIFATQVIQCKTFCSGCCDILSTVSCVHDGSACAAFFLDLFNCVEFSTLLALIISNL